MDSGCPGADLAIQRLREVWREVQKNFGEAQGKHKVFADKRRSTGPISLVGDKVWLSSKNIRLKVPSAKLGPRFIGPYELQRAREEQLQTALNRRPDKSLGFKLQQPKSCLLLDRSICHLGKSWPKLITSDTASEGEVREQSEQEQHSQVVAKRRNVPQRDDEEFYIDNEHLIRLVEERIPLWDSRDKQYKETVVTWQLWNEVAAAMMDGCDSASPTSKNEQSLHTLAGAR
ncbi:uncharacterized protein [Dendrobates tinctorius]|uniref:uncharacterized protein n=1 Tax=Dendrobates tinctorius TaxID=92724 RepID=UPI003CC9DE50